jgi:hypothetical protein
MVVTAPGVVGISRWLAPKLIDPPPKEEHRQPAATEQADVFACAMLYIEVHTGELPFGDGRYKAAILVIARGRRQENLPTPNAVAPLLRPDICDRSTFIQKP